MHGPHLRCMIVGAAALAQIVSLRLEDSTRRRTSVGPIHAFRESRIPPDLEAHVSLRRRIRDLPANNIEDFR